MREAKPLELATNRHCRQIDAELGSQDTLQVHASPADHAMLLRIGAGLHQLPQCLLLLHRQLRPTTRWFDIDEAKGFGKAAFWCWNSHRYCRTANLPESPNHRRKHTKS